MNRFYKVMAISVCLVLAGAGAYAQKGKVSVYMTDPANNVLFQPQEPLALAAKEGSQNLITVDDKQKFQKIDGFGWALTGGSAGHLMGMGQEARSTLLKELFSPEGNGIGGSYIRLSIGASDLDEEVFSYNDLPKGQVDTLMSRFGLGHDLKAVIPVMKEILAINSDIRIMASPWSPPAWMKTNNAVKGGSLKPEFYKAYALYLARYIYDMKRQGITIDAITVQNEPLHPGNTPSLLMLAPDQATFIREHLGPMFKQFGIKTKIVIYDHNADRPDYPIGILNDSKAKAFIDGSAFHLYGGKIEALSTVHDAHPDKNIYFTEQWVGAPGNLKKDIAEHVRNLIIGATRNWSKNVIEWNLSSNPELKPHTDNGGCDRCLGAITIDKDNVTRNPAYYIIAHAAKFVRPGSTRIASNDNGVLRNVAFKTSSGNTVLIVLNDGKEAASFDVNVKKQSFTATLNPGATATYVW
jgi:glucosylceramidase